LGVELVLLVASGWWPLRVELVLLVASGWWPLRVRARVEAWMPPLTSLLALLCLVWWL
jgi:hypothetical protein